VLCGTRVDVTKQDTKSELKAGGMQSRGPGRTGSSGKKEGGDEMVDVGEGNVKEA
jgi:hypothetical protein